MKAFPYLAAAAGALLLASMVIRSVAAVTPHHIPRDASAAAPAARLVATTPAVEAGRGNLASTR